jgi:hypothetical protein
MDVVFDPAVADALAQQVSFRLENVTARNVLEVLLKQHRLRAEKNPETGIYRITGR